MTVMNLQQTLREIAKFQFILSEGRKGNHLLFRPEKIRAALARSPEDLKRLFGDRLDDINQALSHTFTLASFEEKRGYIETLPGEIQDAMIYGYFQLLEDVPDDARTVN